MRKTCVVLGAGGFIGHAMVTRLKKQGCKVLGVDLKMPEFSTTEADEFLCGDLTDPHFTSMALGWYGRVDEVRQLAANMGGAAFVFSGDNDADIMHDSTLININVAKSCVKHKIPKLFFSSSACIYPAHIQTDPNNPGLKESDAYPADPDSVYGVEKLLSEKLYDAFRRNYGLAVRIARFHNIMGPRGTWTGGREKSPAAICRKVAEAPPNGTIEIWGDGEQTRSFLYVDECLDGVEALMASDCTEPINIGSSEIISINDLAKLVMQIAGKELSIKHIPGPLGVRGRTSDNTMCKARTGWEPKMTLHEGLTRLYPWIEQQVRDR